MNIGKLTVNALKRSVLKEIKLHRDEITESAGVGTDCAFFVSKDHTETAFCSDVSLPNLKDGYIYSVYKVAANLAAAGAEPVAVMVNMILPTEILEEQIKEIMGGIQNTCDMLNMEIAGGHTELSEMVKEPVITLTGIGKRAVVGKKATNAVTAGLDLVVTKWIGLEGTTILAKEGKESLLTRYPERMVNEAADFLKYLDVYPEAAYAVKSGVCKMHDISRGGILAALWEMVASAGVGLEIDLKKIPIKQETVEICEHFGLNPYGMVSGGSLLIAAKDGESLVEELAKQHIHAQVIGRTTDNNDKIIRNDEDVRYLDRPAQDEIYKFLGGINPCN